MQEALATSRFKSRKIIYCYIRNTCTGPYLVYFWTKLHEILAPCLKSNFMTTLFSTFLHSEEALTSLRPPPPQGGGRGRGSKNLGNDWSKSIVLENKMVINFDLRQGAKKSGQLGHPFRSYGYLSI